MRTNSTNDTTSLPHFSQEELSVLKYNLQLAFAATRYTHKMIPFILNRSKSHPSYEQKRD